MSFIKTIFKTAACVLATLLVVPALLFFGGCALFLGRQTVFAGWSQAFSLIPGLSGVYLRRAFYHVVLPEVGSDACICFGVLFSHPTARVGNHVYVGPFCSLGDVTLEDDVLIGSHTSIMNGSAQHSIDRLDVPVREQPGTWPRVTIGCDTWIGDRCVVMADVGRHCVVGAGSVVTKRLPDYAIAVGNPARIIAYRDGSQTSSSPSAIARVVG